LFSSTEANAAQDKDKDTKPEAEPPTPPGTPEAIPAPKKPASKLPSTIVPHSADVTPTECGDKPCVDKACTTKSPYWVSGEFLLWWIEDAHIRGPLVSTGPTSSFGFLGNPGAFGIGPSHLDYETMIGGRLSAGYWLDCEGSIGVEASGFYLGDGSTRFGFQGDNTGSPVLARPVVNTLTGIETGEFVSFPGAFAGGIQVASSSRLWGADINARARAITNCNLSVDMLLGARYFDLDEDLRIDQGSQILGGGVAALNGPLFGPSNSIAIHDGFSTRNIFYGGQLGMRAGWRQDRITVDVIAKLALGVNHESDTIAGSTTIISPTGATTSASGGLLAISSNIGHHTHDEFAILPEVTINVGYQLSNSIRVFVGYNFLYLDEAARPGDQIDRTVNPSRVPSSIFSGPVPFGPAVPTGNVRSGDFWAQGVNFGIAFRY
jgi:hypothetical protein